MTLSPAKKAYQALKKAQKILIVTEKNSSPDSVCAAIALHSFCQKHETASHAIVPAGIGKRLSFLQKDFTFQSSLKNKQNLLISIPNTETEAEKVDYVIEDDRILITVVPKEGFFNPKDVVVQPSTEKYDLIITLNIDSFAELQEHFSNNSETLKNTPIININNDLGNEEYGHINLGHPNKASLSETIYDIIEEDGQIEKETATVLLAGITASTESFLGKRVTSEAFQTASKLQSLGATHSEIIENLFKKKSLETLKIWGRIMGNCQYDPKHKIAWSTVTQADLEITNANPGDIETIAQDILCNIEEAEIALLFFEDGEDSFLQLRTEKENIVFPQWQEVFPGAQFQKKTKGIDILFPELRPSEAEYNVLSVIGKLQKTRLDLPEDLKLKSIQIQVPNPANDHRKSFSPENLPFIAPEANTKKPKERTTPIWLEE